MFASTPSTVIVMLSEMFAIVIVFLWFVESLTMLLIVYQESVCLKDIKKMSCYDIIKDRESMEACENFVYTAHRKKHKFSDIKLNFNLRSFILYL